MRFRLVVGVACMLAPGLPAPRAHALQVSSIPVSPTETILAGRGPIVAGDAERLQAAVAGLPPSLHLLGLTLDSPGGSVAEAKQLAGIIRATRLAVIIPQGGICASACFMLLAASPRRLAAGDAVIGVHSAAEHGAETDKALAVTTLMARDAADMGVPPAIIGKMVETAPGRMARLDPQDLALMNVTVFGGDLLAALHPTEWPADRRASPAAPFATPAASGFAAGRDDRRSWDAWLGSLRGAFRDGVLFARDGVLDPAPCGGPDSLSRGDFTLGCEVARRRFAPIAARLRGDAEYAAGWNAGEQPLMAAEPVEQVYEGVYFCTGAVVHLTLKVYPPSAAPPSAAPPSATLRRRALVLFGPNASSSDVPHGAFLVEGSIDPAAGEIALAPVKWVVQPAGMPWLGLSGRSADGGRTYRGRVTESSTCTLFTLARVQRKAGPER